MKRIIALLFVLAVVFGLCGCTGSDYRKAQKLFEEGRYEEARGAFEKLGDYEESHDYFAKCCYYIAQKLFEESRYEDALTLFEEADSFEDSDAMITECKRQITLTKYGKILSLLAETSPWFYNGGSNSLLNGISFSGADISVDSTSYSGNGGQRRNDVSAPGALEATIDTVFFDGNGSHHQKSDTHPFEIDDSKITVNLENDFTLTIPYSVNGGVLRLGDGEYFTVQNVDTGLQGFWSVQYSSASIFGGSLKHEYNVQIKNGTITMEHANEGVNLPKGRYYFDTANGTYKLGFGSIEASDRSIWGWYFNIIDNKPTLLHFDTVLSPSDGLPGQNGYKF